MIQRISCVLAVRSILYLLAGVLWTWPVFTCMPALAQSEVRTLEGDPQVQIFVAEVSKKYGISPRWLRDHLEPIRPNDVVLNAILPPSTPAQRSWQAYRARFLNSRVPGGVEFWNRHAAALKRAQAEFNVPAEIIVAIIGVETEYGRNMGRFSVLQALATLAFRYPPRSAFFRNELEQFLLYCREMSVEPEQFKGSYAGAIGIPQFMPSSIRRYAVDYDNNGIIDLYGSPGDAIGSVASFLAAHGWVKDGAIAQPATVSGDPAPLIAAGIRPVFTLSELAEQGIRPAISANAENADRNGIAALIDLPDVDQPTEYWLGYENFYVITRYNRSSFYAMSVFQLAEAIAAARNAKSAKKVEISRNLAPTGRSMR